MTRLGADDGEGGIGSIIGGLGDVVDGITGAVSYWSDPWGNTFKALQDAAKGLSKDVLPALTDATLPDLSADWFLRAYAISFAASIFVAVALLLPQVLRTARGLQAGRDLVESVGLYFGFFLTGAMFGPALGMVLVNFFHALSNDIVEWGLRGTVSGVIGDFQTMISSADPVGITGGLPIAVLLMLCMVIGLLLVFAMLVVQLVTLYFTGVLLPLGLVWIIDPGKRQFGTKIVSVWIGILAAHPLLFFLLGFAFVMMANSVATFGNNLNLQSLVMLSVAVISLFIAAFSPLLLMKLAPVIPTGFGGTRGPALAAGSIGPRNMSEATAKFDRSGSTSANGTRAGAGRGSSASSPPMSSSAAAESGSTTLAKASAARAGTTAATSATSAAGAGTTGAAAGGGLAAVGAAETSTGAGAAIGIPTVVLAAGVAAASQGVRMTEAAGQQATAAMDDSTIGAERT